MQDAAAAAMIADGPHASLLGQSLRRREDAALLRGAGRFLADIVMPDCREIVFVRGAEPGTLKRIRTEAARGMPGVIGIFTASDLALAGEAAVNPLAPALTVAPLPVLAGSRIGACGQPVGAVVARSLAEAMLAAEAVEVEIASGDASPPGGFAERWACDAMPQAAVRAAVRLRHARLAAMPMEPRGALATWDTKTPLLVVWLQTQSPHRARDDLAAILGEPVRNVRVVAPDVGGAFGARASIGAEEVFTAWAARHLGGAVRWRGTRAEELLAGPHGRGLESEGELALAADGRMLGLRARVRAPMGHWMPYSAVVPGRNAARVLPGPYDVAALDIAAEGHATATAPMGIYRGAGRPEGAMLMERLVDAAARRLGMDPVALRRRNLLAPGQLPRTRATGTLDSGDFPALLDRAVALSSYTALREAQALRRQAGEIVGIGVAMYVEPCGQGWESARIGLNSDGSFEVATGTTAQGQGRETAFAQIAASVLRCEPGQVRVRHGDTAATPDGIGALASRSTGIGGSALLRAAEALVERARPIAERALGDGARLAAGGFEGPAGFLPWAALAARAPEPLSAELRFVAGGEAWSSGCCIAALRCDPDTLAATVEALTLVDDAGRVVNPMLVEGQLLGGIAQGLGEALRERVVYDAAGQLLTGSLMDYALPRADDMPPLQLASLATPTPLNPLGAKGVGEAGCIGVPAAVVNAAVDALSPFGVEHLNMPLTAESLWRARHGLPPREEG